MQGEFSYHNPTKLYFGKGAVSHLSEELPKYAAKGRILMVWGSGSIKKNGIYGQIRSIMDSLGIEPDEIGGVMPNPTVEKLYEGIRVARASLPALILAVGGGSVCDYAKALAASVHCTEDPWVKYYLHDEEPTCEVIPVACVLTMVGTGSEMNGGSVITNRASKLKIGKVFGEELMPRFTVLDPTYTLTVPKRQMIAGIYDIFCHICEQYFSGNDVNVSDDLAEALLRAVVRDGSAAAKNPEDYEARSNLMWSATWALNTLLSRGKSTDWMVHMLGQAVGACTDATHGMTLSAVTLAYYRHILGDGTARFARFAVNVFSVSPEGKTEREVAEEGLEKLENWMREMGLCLRLSELGVTEGMLPDLVRGTVILNGGYRTLDAQEILQIFKESI